MLMICGAIGFSFAAGSLSSILSQMDNVDSKLKEKMNVLEDIK